MNPSRVDHCCGSVDITSEGSILEEQHCADRLDADTSCRACGVQCRFAFGVLSEGMGNGGPRAAPERFGPFATTDMVAHKTF